MYGEPNSVHVCVELFIHSHTNYVISSALPATADCCFAGSGLL